jgi:ABC-type sugar transport system ATPase subunit
MSLDVHRADDTPLLHVDSVSKRFGGVQALSSVSFTVAAREVLAIVGANGAGKSTLVKLLGGVLRPDSGEIWLDGERLDRGDVNLSRSLGVEVVYQDLGLVPNMDAAFNLFLGRTPRRYGFFVDRRKMLRETRAVLEALHISTLRNLSIPVENLSGGQRQALAIGRTLASRRRVAVFDEPAAALGVEESEEVLRLIERLRDEGTAVITVSHNMDHVFRLADRILVMHSGCAVACINRDDAAVDQIVQLIMLGEL